MNSQNTRGFTVVEIVVGLAVIGFLALVMGQIQSVFIGQNTVASQRIDFENLKIDVRSILYSRNQCRRAFRQGNLDLKYTGTPVQVSSLNMVRPAQGVDRPVVQAGEITPSGVRVDSMVLQPFGVNPAPAPGATSKTYRVEMVINTTTTKGPRAGEQRNTGTAVAGQPNSRFKFYIKTDQNDEITECAWRGEELARAEKGCDLAEFASYRTPNPSSGLPAFMRIYDYGYLPDWTIDDGGASGGNDDGYFYCTTSGGGKFGSLAVCLSKENCPWR